MSYDPYAPMPSAPSAPPKRRRGRKIVIGVAAAAVLIAIGAAAANGGKKNNNADPSASPAAPETATGSGLAPTAAPAVRTPAATRTPTVVLTMSGNGTKTSKSFTVGSDWTVAYTFDCSAFGYQGNFQVWDEDMDMIANVLDKSGTDETEEYNAGTHHLTVNSECKWTIKVTDNG